MRKFLQMVFILLGCGFLLYSPISNWFEEQRVQGLLDDLNKQVREIDPEDYSELRNAAILYNEQLWRGVNSGEEDLLDQYENILNLNGKGLIGRIEIPSVDIDLPIYHGEDEETLAMAAGHHIGSAFPVGTNNSRVVLSAHTGLATPKLFTRIDELEEGDMFFLNVLDETYAYEVFKIEVILPTETEKILPVEGEDLVTLLTCTPYGINTHRLLVTGRRTELSKEEIIEAKEETSTKLSWHELVFYVLPAIIVVGIFAYFVIKRILKKRKKRNGKEVNNETNMDDHNGMPNLPLPPTPQH